VAMCRQDAEAAVVFYRNIHHEIGAPAVCKLIRLLMKCMMLCIESEERGVLMAEKENNEDAATQSRKRSSRADHQDEWVSGEDQPLMEALLAVMEALFSSIIAKLHTPDGEAMHRHVLATFGEERLQTLLEAHCSEAARVAIIKMAALLPGEHVTSIAERCLPRLLSLPADAQPETFVPLVDCLLAWGRAGPLIQALIEMLSSSNGGHSSRTERPVKGKAKRANKKKSTEHPMPFPLARLALQCLEHALASSMRDQLLQDPAVKHLSEALIDISSTEAAEQGADVQELSIAALRALGGLEISMAVFQSQDVQPQLPKCLEKTLLDVSSFVVGQIALDPTAASTPLPKRRSRRNAAPECSSGEETKLPHVVILAQLIAEITADAAGVGATGMSGLVHKLCEIMQSASCSEGSMATILPAVCHAAHHLLDDGSTTQEGVLLLRSLYVNTPASVIVSMRPYLCEVLSKCPPGKDTSQALATVMVQRHAQEAEDETELSTALSHLAIVTHRGPQTSVQMAKAVTEMLEMDETAEDAGRFLRAYTEHVVASLRSSVQNGTEPVTPGTPGLVTPSKTPTTRPAPAGVLETIKEGVEVYVAKAGLSLVMDEMAQGILTACEAA